MRSCIFEMTQALTAANVNSVFTQQWWDNDIKKIAAEEQAIPIWHEQESAV